MNEIEVGFKIKQTKEEAEQILLSHGFVNTFKTAHTRDIYFGKDINFKNKTEEEIKRSLVRCRGLTLFENLQLLDSTIPEGKVNVDFKTAVSYFDSLFKAGFDVIFDTEKTDWIYNLGNCWHQLQDIKDIGLLDYVYIKEENTPQKGQDELFNMLKKHMQELGFTLEYELGVDKLRSLYYKKPMFSKNQIGLYAYQQQPQKSKKTKK